MKIIFLGVDNVLNSATDFTDASMGYDPVHSHLEKSERWLVINAGKLGLLNDLVKTTGAKIVLTSHWRLDYGKTLTPIFQRYGSIWQHYDSTFFGWTDDLRHDMTGDGSEWRQLEIQNFIKANCISDYVIFDSTDNIRLPHTEYSDRFIKTYKSIGLTMLHIKRAISILGRETVKISMMDRIKKMING